MQFTESRLNAAIEIAKQKADGNRALLNAIDKAAAGLRGGWIVTELHDGLLITSDSGQTYKANGVCSCAAYQNGMVCKHRVAYRIVALYNECNESDKPIETAATSRADLEAAIVKTWSTKFPHDNLADALMYRFKVNSLSFLADGWLQDILAAIA